MVLAKLIHLKHGLSEKQNFNNFFKVLKVRM